MGKALDDLLMAAADLDVKEMRELITGVRNRMRPSMLLTETDVLLALNAWGEDRQKQSVLDIPPKPKAPSVNDAFAQRFGVPAPPTLDDVRFLVRAQLPSLVRIMQLRKLLGMEAEPSLDGDLAADLAALAEVREVMREHWAHERSVADADCRAICVQIARALNMERNS